MSDELLASIHTELLAQSQTLAGLKTSMDSLVGNGQPGRISIIESDIEDLKSSNNKRIGAASAFASIITGWEVCKHFFKIS